jgi:hypothetical protein
MSSKKKSIICSKPTFTNHLYIDLFIRYQISDATFNNKEVLLSRSLHQLSRGRLEIIQNYKLTCVVLECAGITDGCKADIIELAQKHGLVKKLDVLQGRILRFSSRI